MDSIHPPRGAKLPAPISLAAGTRNNRQSPDTGASKSPAPFNFRAWLDVADAEYLRSRIRERDEFNADLATIGWGLAAGAFFVVVFRLAVLFS